MVSARSLIHDVAGTIALLPGTLPRLICVLHVSVVARRLRLDPFAAVGEPPRFSSARTEFDVNREPNNSRGPVDFKVSYGKKDKSLIEFKLGSNTSLQRNLEKQVAIYGLFAVDGEWARVVAA